MESHPTIQLPPLPANTPILEAAGRGLLWFATGLFLLALVSSFFAKSRRLTNPAFVGGCVSILSALGLLIWLTVNKQYQFEYVFSHSDNWLSFDKRIAATWGGQEGSFLLWASASALFGILSLRSVGVYQRAYVAAYSLILAGLSSILVFESPFRLWKPPAEVASFFAGKMPEDGAGLTPALINKWMVIHPPVMFLGFGSLTVLYALGVAGFLRRDFGTYVQLIRPWALVSLALTGIGLCMGGFWAYETLGWGGFWMWDPVENAALVPWCLVAALMHGLFVQATSKKWTVFNASLGAFALISFIYGTFLTRSGFLGDSSVHSFAEMDRSALQLLISMGAGAILLLIGSAIYYKLGTRNEQPSTLREPVTRLNLHNAYSAATTLLISTGLVSAIGMSVPLFMSIAGQKPKVVEEALYHKVVTWVFIPTVILMGIGPYLSWRGIKGRELAQRLFATVCLTSGFIGVGMLLTRFIPLDLSLTPADQTNFPFGIKVPTLIWVFFLAGVCLFGLSANLVRAAELIKKSPSSIGSFLTHFGVIMTVLGLIISRGMEKKQEATVQLGRPATVLGYRVSLDKMSSTLLERENQVGFKLEGRDQTFKLNPVLFYTESRNGEEPSPTVRPAIRHFPLHDLYFTVFPMVFEATGETPFKVGEKRQFEGTVIKYVKMTREGEVGVMGTKFGAHLEFQNPDGSVSHITPKFEISDSGPIRIPAESGDYFVYLMGMDAADKSVRIQLHYKNPIFPIEIFYKPMTGMVWWGAGIMTFGGFLAAWFRRRDARAALKSATPAIEEPEAPESAESEVPTAVS